MEKKLFIRTEHETNVVHSIGRLLGSHRVVISNAEETNVGSVEVVDHLHISKHACITTVVDVVVYG